MVPRFGELADYVYCTYCAALLLERMDQDRLQAFAEVEMSGFRDVEATCSGCLCW